ncbi:MAG TPA: hypothetical protein VF510_13020 [Ktedonobacterales bacterium]
MERRDPEPIEQLDHTQLPAGEMADGNTGTQPSMWSGWRGPLIGGLVAVIVVFAVLDIGHFLFPQRTLGTSRPIIIQVQNGGGDTGNSVPPVLTAAPQTLDLSCGHSAALTLTNTASYGIHWTLDTVPDGITFTANSPRGGGLAPGEHATLQVVSLGKRTSATLHFTEDRGTALDVTVRVQC